MPAKRTPARTRSRTVQVDAEHYRSLILSKLRAEIDARRAAFELASRVDPSKLQDMGYWKMKYWKMKYWKKGDQILDPMAPVINPAIGKTIDHE